jgi:hypothetical protein
LRILEVCGRWAALSVVALALGIGPANAAGEKALDLDGYRFLLLGAGESQARVGNPKTIHINVALSDDAIHADRKRLIEASDRLFESVLMGAAEKGYHARATVNVRRPGTASFEDFLYVRGANGVWLRQAGAEAWKVAQDPTAWKAAPSEKMQIATFGTFAVEQAVEVGAPAGFKRVAEINFVTRTPIADVQRKYEEVKALWARMDRAQMRSDGFDLVVFANYAEPRRGRFHARKAFIVRIPRQADGDWPTLPERAPDGREMLLSHNDAPASDLTQRIAATFEDGILAGLELGDFVAAPFALGMGASTAQVGFAQGTPAILDLGPVPGLKLPLRD